MKGSNMGIVEPFFRPGEIVIEYEDRQADTMGKMK